MNPYIEQVNTYLENRPASHSEPVLELLSQFYTIDNPVDNVAIRCRFEKLDQILQPLTLAQNNQVFSLVCDLCTEHTHKAFLEGVQAGYSLSRELEVPTK